VLLRYNFISRTEKIDGTVKKHLKISATHNNVVNVMFLRPQGAVPPVILVYLYYQKKIDVLCWLPESKGVSDKN
jgi:hypothetical protein